MNWSLLNQVQPKPSYEDASYYLNAEFSLFGNVNIFLITNLPDLNMIEISKKILICFFKSPISLVRKFFWGSSVDQELSIIFITCIFS